MWQYEAKIYNAILLSIHNTMSILNEDNNLLYMSMTVVKCTLYAEHQLYIITVCVYHIDRVMNISISLCSKNSHQIS